MEMWGTGEGLNRIGVYFDIVDSLYNVVEGHYGVVSTCFFIGNCWGG